MKFPRTVMGRKVVHHSPDKFPASTDPSYDEMDKMVEEAAKQMTGSFSNARQETRPFDKVPNNYRPGGTRDQIPNHPGGLGDYANDYLGRLLKGKKK